MQCTAILNGKDFDCDLPFHPKEIRFDDYSVMKYHEGLFMALQKAEEIDFKALAIKKQEMLGKIFKFDLSNVPRAIDGETMTTLYDAGLVLLKDSRLSLDRLYCHLIHVCNSFEADYIPTVYESNGIKFEITKQRAKALLTGEDTTTGQFLEIMELQKRADQLLAATGDGTEAIDFNLGVREMCFLLCEKNEKIPWKRGAQARWLASKTKTLSGLNMEDVLKIRFFLIRLYKTLSIQEITSYSSNQKLQFLKVKKPEAPLRKLKTTGGKLAGQYITRLRSKLEPGKQ